MAIASFPRVDRSAMMTARSQASELKPQERVTAYWDTRGGEAYDAQATHSPHDTEVADAWQAAVERYLPEDRAARILDVGTGTGFLAIMAADLGYPVTGIDLSEGMLATARAKTVGHPNPPQLLVGDAIQPNFAPGSFDVILNRHLLWTLVDPDAAARAWFMLLKPGGVVVAWDSLWWNAGYLAPMDDEETSAVGNAWNTLYGDETLDALPLSRAVVPDELMAMFVRAGFEDVRIDTDPSADRAHRANVEPERGESIPPTLAIVARKPSVPRADPI
ncbi:MAG: methyltransferase domain-containing protein [Thermomicrobiales bacterium]|nr:methyltransferase domain-containing protein [Thermomicrobiales bacterium]